MRQVLEAFATFQYQKGIDDVLSKKELNVIMNSNQKFIPYFNCLMSRLLLHGGSHREEQVYSMRDYNFSELISPSEKIRTAKDILCFIFLINPQHMLHHIQNNNAEKMLKEWCNEIEKRV